MASFSQLRLAQLSGSFGNSAGQMNDLLAPLARAAHSGSEQGLSLADHLSHVVSSLKRIHGASEFSTAEAGEFTHTITPASADGAALGTAAKEWSDLFLADGGVINLGSDQDVTLTHVADTGVLLNSTRQIQFGSSAAYIRHDGTDLELVDDADINIKPAVDFLVDAGGDIILDAAGDEVQLKHNGDLMLQFASGSDSVVVKPGADHEDIIFQEDGGTEVFRMDSSAEAILMASGKEIQFADTGEAISGNGTDLTIKSGADINLTATTDINIPANVGLTFGDDAEKIEGDGTDLTVSGNNIKLTAVADVILPANVGLVLDGSGSEKIESDGTDINFSVGSDGDINIPADIGLTFGDDGEKIEGDGTNLSIASSGELDLTAGANLDVNVTGTVDVDASSTVSIDTSDTSNGITLGTGTSGVPISIGHTTSEVTVNDNLTVTGDLTVNGATTTLDTTNLKVEDPVILFGSGSTSANSNGGLALLSGSATASQALVFGRVANNMWGVGRKDVTDGTVTTLADMSMVDTGLRAGKFQISGSSDHIALNPDASDALTITAGAGLELVNGSGDIVLDSAGDVVIDGTSQKLEFGSAGSGEHITGDGTDLTVASGGKINLTATSDVILPANVGLVLDGSGDEKIESDGTDINFSVGSNGDINVPANIGMTFGDDGEKIEGDGSGLTVAGGTITLDSEGDINLDAAGDDIILKTDGTTMLTFTSGSDNVVLKPGSDHEDIIFQEDGGNEVFRLDSSAESLLMAGDQKIEIRDAGLFLYSSADGKLDVGNSDGTAVDSIDVASTAGGIKLDAGLDGNAAAIHLDSASGVTIAGGDQNDSVYIENSPIQLEAFAAGGEPSSTTGKLYNVTGSLVWNGKVITPRSQKVSYTVTGSHAATDDLVISGLSHDRGVNSLQSDVFLNGQLMLSGAGQTTGDYKLSGTVTNVRFHFGLEADDVVTVITMAS